MRFASIIAMSNTQTSRFVFEPACEADGKELLAILEAAAFKGKISLLYTRRPDAYRSLKQEAQEVQILLARDTKHHKIAGFGACALRELFVNGQPARVGYLFSLRLASDYLKKTPILHRGFRLLHSQNQTKGIVCYLTTILEENRYAQKLFEKPRPFMPTYTPFGIYEIFAMPCRSAPRSKRRKDDSLVFSQATSRDAEELSHFLHREGRKLQFFPVVHAEDLQNRRFYGITIEDFYLLRSKMGEMLAAGLAWDQRHYKQYIVQSYGGVFRYLRPFSRILPFFGYPSLPAPGNALAFFTLSFWAIKDNHPELFECFLQEIMQVSGHYPFFLIGLHERHPFHSLLQKRPHISYRSIVYQVSWQESSALLKPSTLPYLECGLL